jgi:hypothetical protein
LNQEEKLEADATIDAFKIQMGIFADGFTGSFEGYTNEYVEDGIKSLEEDYKIPMKLYKCYHEQHEFFGGKIPTPYYTNDATKTKTLDCIK